MIAKLLYEKEIVDESSAWFGVVCYLLFNLYLEFKNAFMIQ